MRRKKVFLFVFLVCLFFSTLNTEKVRAQGEFADLKPTENPGGNYDINKDGKLDETEQANLAADTAKNKEEANGFWSPIINAINNAGLGLISWTVYGISYFLAWLTSLFLNLASGLFEICLKIGVIDLANILKDEGVRSLWEIFRNIGNIALVFVILYIAISTILQISSEATKLLGKVIVVAVLMNFSFFFGAIIVDVSNIMALNIYEQVYEAIPDDEEYKINGKKQIGTYIDVKAGAGSVGEKLGVKEGSTGDDSTVGPSAVESWANKGLAEAVGLIMLIILDIVLAIILIIASFSIIGRMVAIILLLLVSPIAFMAMVLPKTRQMSSDWWQSIIGQSFYLPLFLLFIYVGIKTIEVISSIQLLDPGTLEANSSLTDKFIYIAPLIVKFSMVIGIFLAALIAANKVSSQGSQIVNKIAGSVKSKVAGATLGGAALLGRNTIGQGANILAESKLGQKIGSMRGGDLLMQGARNISKRNFDIRGSKTFAGVASATGVGEKVFGGPSGKDGFVGQQKRAVERAVARGKSIDLSEREKAEKENLERKMSDFISSDVTVSGHRKDLKTAEDNLKEAKAKGDKAAMKIEQNRIVALNNALKNSTDNVKKTKEYKELEDKLKPISDKKDSIEKQKKAYANKLANSWLSASRIGASKILKDKSVEDKMFERLKKQWEAEEKKKGGTP